MNNLTQQDIRKLYDYSSKTGTIQRRDEGVAGMYHATNGYLRLRYKGKSCSAHRVIWMYMTGNWPEGDVDHIDHDRLNNRWCNLRVVSRKENMQNASISKSNKSGFTGVGWCRQQRQWRAQIMVDGKSIKLGRFDKVEDAIDARKRANAHYAFHPNHGKKANA